MKNRKIVLTFKKSTKGTHIYENGDLGISWYLPKALFDGGEPPATLLVDLSAKTN